jgi:hypothetical protein
MVAMVAALVLLAQALPATNSSVVSAAGTRIQAQLEQPVSTRSMRDGETIVMSVDHELLVGSRVALPAGTRIIARIDTISHASVLMETEALAAGHAEIRPAASEKRCFVGGSPGTPDVTIAGSPPLLGSDGVPLNSGTPPTIIPGIPPTPASWVPC